LQVDRNIHRCERRGNHQNDEQDHDNVNERRQVARSRYRNRPTMFLDSELSFVVPVKFNLK
jgi:hypothetical protein